MITVSRDSGWTDRFRNYQVLLDGAVIGEIESGEQKSFEVAAGTHHIALKIDWCQTKPIQFNITDGEVHFNCGSSLRGWRLFLAAYYILFKQDQYIWLTRTGD